VTNLFDFIRDVIAQKEGDLLNDPDNAMHFVPYLTQRWVSFFDYDFISLLNNTTNRMYPVFKRKEDWYKYFLVVVPKSRFHKVRYIKKSKKDSAEKKDNNEAIKFLARHKQMSVREVKEYIELFGVNIEELKKTL
jgi:hypothetical protein